MNNTRLKELLSKYLEGTASEAETREVDEWYASFESQPALTSGLSAEERAVLEQLMFLRISRDIEAQPSLRVSKRPARYWWAAAAAVVLLAGAAWLATRQQVPLVQQSEILASVEAGKGSIKKVMLPDSSTVWLNFDSKLTYAADGREVWLQGEGAFDVTTAGARAFVVHAGALDVKVLGTSFNIDAYTPAEKVTVTVAGGKVAVGNSQLTQQALVAGQQAIFVPAENMVRTLMTEAGDVMAWRQGQLVFKRMLFRDIAKKLERRYDAQIRFQDNEVANALLTASFDEKTTLAGAIDMLCDIYGFKYQRGPGKNEYLVWKARKK